MPHATPSVVAPCALECRPEIVSSLDGRRTDNGKGVMSPSQLAPDPFLPGARESSRRATAAADILFRLPALYRESPGALLPLAQAIADTAAWLADEASRW